MQVKKQQLEFDMEQYTGSKLGREYIKAVYCHPAHLTYMQSTSCEILGWMKHKLESSLLHFCSRPLNTEILMHTKIKSIHCVQKKKLMEEISIMSDMQITPFLWQKVKKN